jgi:ubiquinone biosynthesis accessory factor UbiK
MLHFKMQRLSFGLDMIETLLQAILEQIDQPKKDLESNLRAILSETVTKMDLVSREEIERHKTALNNANLRLNDLQQQLTELERLISIQK